MFDALEIMAQQVASAHWSIWTAIIPCVTAIIIVGTATAQTVGTTTARNTGRLTSTTILAAAPATIATAALATFAHTQGTGLIPMHLAGTAAMLACKRRR